MTSGATGSPTIPSRSRGTTTSSRSPDPDVIAGIHRAYLDAGADIIETNTFNSNKITMVKYRPGRHVPSR